MDIAYIMRMRPGGRTLETKIAELISYNMGRGSQNVNNPQEITSVPADKYTPSAELQKSGYNH